MEKESFIGAFGDVPTDLAGDYSPLFIFRTEDFGAWYRRVRDAHKREVDGGVAGMTDAQLAEHGLVRMPTDADGKPIRIGDVMWQKDRITKRACKAIMGDAYVMLDGIQGAVYAKGLTHYREPTVEDVLREFTDEVWNRCCEGATASDSGIDELVAEYAAKLRLAKEGE